MNNVFIGCLSYDGRIEQGTGMGIYQKATRHHKFLTHVKLGSALTANCNHLWCMALNLRDKHQLNWFALVHADIIPEPYWLDKLIEIAEANQADFLSAVVPIKDWKGITSTAIDDPTDIYWPITRLTMKQVWHDSFPETFDIETCVAALHNLPDHLAVKDLKPTHLLANTGCMICRLDRPWSEKLYFTIFDSISREADGSFKTRFHPEDWFFSKLVATAGGKVMCTKAVHCFHAGGDYWDSHVPRLGALEIDDKIKPAELWTD